MKCGIIDMIENTRFGEMKMNIKCKNASTSTFILWSAMIIPLGILLVAVKDDIEFLPLFVVAGLIPSLYMPYKRFNKEKPEMIEYMDLRRMIIIAMIGVSLLYAPYLILGIQFNKIIGVTFILFGVGNSLIEILDMSKRKAADGEDRDNLILNDMGIKIPGYVLIPWSKVDEVIRYKDGSVDTTGILVESAVQYKINGNLLDRVITGSKRRVIGIRDASLISQDKDVVDKVTRYIKKKIES